MKNNMLLFDKQIKGLYDLGCNGELKTTTQRVFSLG